MAKLTYNKRILPDSGKHLVAITQCVETENQFYDPKEKGSQKTRLEWTFSYTEKPEMQIRDWSGTSLSIYQGKKAKALRIVEAAEGKELTQEEKESFNDTDPLIGGRLYITVKHDKRENGEIFAKIIDYESESGLPF